MAQEWINAIVDRVAYLSWEWVPSGRMDLTPSSLSLTLPHFPMMQQKEPVDLEFP